MAERVQNGTHVIKKVNLTFDKEYMNAKIRFSMPMKNRTLKNWQYGRRVIVCVNFWHSWLPIIFHLDFLLIKINV